MESRLSREICFGFSGGASARVNEANVLHALEHYEVRDI